MIGGWYFWDLFGEHLMTDIFIYDVSKLFLPFITLQKHTLLKLCINRIFAWHCAFWITYKKSEKSRSSSKSFKALWTITSSLICLLLLQLCLWWFSLFELYTKLQKHQGTPTKHCESLHLDFFVYFFLCWLFDGGRSVMQKGCMP